ncbi:TIGR04206 family protein [Halorhabdus sp. CBA1104]|uniref:TIGR04206 family protein n=1 Tax=unclassified Halorhabdus TaxID=2621901 RepID=UPI0012B3150C|nr:MULTISPECIES: TIGR04206 family protein [unclassified Halorhabdus]QGN07812.1 TIGR04206 family protein [Halorhabdus sp. CBA1104]
MPTNDSARIRLCAVLSLLVVPWTGLLSDGYVTLLVPWGLLDPFGPHLTLLPEYLAATGSGPPPFLFAWPLGVGIYGLAVMSALGETIERGDPRLTGGLLVLVGVTQLTVAWGFVRRGSYVVVPLGTLLAWTIAWWFYWPDLRAIGRFERYRG